MTNEELIAKIKAEIERLKGQLIRGACAAQIEMETNCKEEAYDEILSFLSTLESEKPINLDDAMKELDEKIALVKQRGTWDGVDVDKYMDEVRGREPEKLMDLEEEINRYLHEECSDDDEPGIHEIAEHFAEWGYLRAAEKYNEIEYNRQRAEEPVSDDLEEAANKFAVFYDQGTCDGIAQDCFIAGAKWQKEQDEILKVNYEGARTVYDNTVQHLQEKIDEKYELGKRDMKEQMLKEAVEYEVWDFSSSLEACPHITIPLDNKQYRNGDKVRVIVLPKEEE